MDKQDEKVKLAEAKQARKKEQDKEIKKMKKVTETLKDAEYTKPTAKKVKLLMVVEPIRICAMTRLQQRVKQKLIPNEFTNDS